jgi:archaellum component FlaF (FlaF/FlaG flagellin family)
LDLGLSIAIGGGIICATVLLVLSIMFSLTTQTYEVNSARSQSSELERTLIHTNFTISDLYAQSGSDRVSFTLQNTGPANECGKKEKRAKLCQAANPGKKPR